MIRRLATAESSVPSHGIFESVLTPGDGRGIGNQLVELYPWRPSVSWEIYALI
jgi:hypothetical protein